MGIATVSSTIKSQSETIPMERVGDEDMHQEQTNTTPSRGNSMEVDEFYVASRDSPATVSNESQTEQESQRENDVYVRIP